MSENLASEVKIFSIAQDPIYIGTGGYTIGRVDNTIVRDPTTKIPKIPGSSLAGTWRYYVTLALQEKIKDKKPKLETLKNQQDRESFEEKLSKIEWKDGDTDLKKWHKFNGNKISSYNCAGQDELPNTNFKDFLKTEENEKYSGHCGHCIVCRGFGFSKRNLSWQGMLFFSDLKILFFPIYTRLGVRWITSPEIYYDACGESLKKPQEGEILTHYGTEGYLNLGWLNFKVKKNTNNIKIQQGEELKGYLSEENIVVVSDNIVSQLINANLEVRTSVSINPLTGAAKEGALFTYEAIPRGTIFYGSIRIFDKSAFENFKNGIGELPDLEDLKCSLDESKHFYETLGIGGLTTRGFGRMKILSKISNNCEVIENNEQH